MLRRYYTETTSCAPCPQAVTSLRLAHDRRAVALFMVNRLNPFHIESRQFRSDCHRIACKFAQRGSHNIDNNHGWKHIIIILYCTSYRDAVTIDIRPTPNCQHRVSRIKLDKCTVTLLLPWWRAYTILERL